MSATLDRIAALLAKAERTDNELEAEAYVLKAQELATLASVDLAMARARTARREARVQPQTRTTTIGEKGRRANPHLIALFVAVAHANEIRVDIASNSTFVIAYGMPGDLDVVETIFGSLAVHMVHAGQEYVGARTWQTETYIASTGPRGWRRRERRPHTAQTARAGFYRAYVARIGERLEEGRQSALASKPRQTRAERSEQTLVLRDKKSEVTAFHAETSKARGTWGGYSGSVRSSSGSSAEAGHRAASRARLGPSSKLPGGPSALASE